MIDNAEADFDWEMKEVGFGRVVAGGGLCLLEVRGGGHGETILSVKRRAFMSAIGGLSED